MIEINFCPRCGTPITHKETYGRLRPVCPSCNFIYFADPKVAAAVLIEHDKKILLVRRVNDPHKGLWTLPAGFVNAEEDPARAAERECLEETGLIVRVTGIINIHAGREHKRGSDFVIFYRGEMIGGTISAGDDADAVSWFDRRDLPPIAFESTKYILTKI